ncbi:MAG TPA: MFS transporter [Clostridiales bacterium]|nr:MFS transporter [Clostridiales bacterium]
MHDEGMLELRKRNTYLFAVATAFIGFAFATVEHIISNYYDSYGITAVQRGWLEFPRELPGMLLVFISGLLYFLGSAKMGVIAMLLGVAGLLGLGFLTPSYYVMILWLFLYNTGTHLWMPVKAEIGMSLAVEGKTGRQLGRFDMIYTFAGLVGGSLIYLGFKQFSMGYTGTFLICALSLIVAVFILSKIKTIHKPEKEKIKLVFKKQYLLYYLMCMFNGARKQISITFVPWLLIRIFHKTADNMLLIGMASSALGIVVYPLIGRAIDRFGEKKVLAVEALLLAVACIAYIAVNSTSSLVSTMVIAGCILDRMLTYAGNARSTYIKKIAETQDDVLPTISTGISLDHLVSMTIPALGGYIWEAYGYRYVFVGALLIAIINFILDNKMKSIPIEKQESLSL